MRRILLCFLMLIAIMINRGTIFAVVNQNEAFNEEEAVQIKRDINDLLTKRSNLWNKLFSEEAKLEKISEELEEIVVDPLLTYDMEAFKEIKDMNTSMERILNVKVLTIKNVKLDEEKITVDIEVEWLMEGFEENYKEKIDYKMNLIKHDSKWKISDYNII